MSFADKIPEFVKELHAEIAGLQRKRRDIDWGHECDCEFCDRDTSPEPGAEDMDRGLDNDIRECNRLIKRLERYSNLIGQPLESTE